jgi:hypothetical protein
VREGGLEGVFADWESCEVADAAIAAIAREKQPKSGSRQDTIMQNTLSTVPRNEE